MSCLSFRVLWVVYPQSGAKNVLNNIEFTLSIFAALVTMLFYSNPGQPWGAGLRIDGADIDLEPKHAIALSLSEQTCLLLLLISETIF